MKRRFRTAFNWILSSCLVASIGANAQQTGNYNFPQNVQYSFGYMPSGNTSNAALAAYTSWKNAYVVDGPSCATGSTKRVKFDAVSGRFKISGDNSVVTVSEGIAYGMLLTAYYGDKATFDGLWAYYKSFKNANGIMNWGINNGANCAIVGSNGATDAELDVAWALWVAYNQFQFNTTYLNDAKTMVTAIKAYEIDKSGGLNTLKPGDAFGGHGSGNNDLVNPSYFSPAYYRVFGEITNDAAFWTSVYNRGYDILEKAANATTGLVPDWSTSNGVTPAPGASTYDEGGIRFFYDAVRTPVRTALDYLWYGDESPRALAYTQKVNTWLRGKHPNVADIGSQYSLAGDKLQAFHNNTFVGAFAVSAMASTESSSQTYLASLYNNNVATNPGAGEYFNASWKAISLFILTGNFYLPPPDACDTPVLLPAYYLCNGPQTLTVPAGATSYVWKRNGTVISGAATNTYTATQGGTYEITVTVPYNGKPCVRRASTEVYQAAPKADFSFVTTGLNATFTNLSLGGIKSYAWTFGASSNPATATIPNPITSYTAPGLKLVTLTVTDQCNTTNSITKELTIAGSSTADGWYATDFRGDIPSPGQAVYIAPSLETAAPAGSITVNQSNCKFATASFLTTTTQYSSVAIVFKDPIKGTVANDYNWALNIADYPYVRFRVKVDQAVDSFRVDLLDNAYNSTSLKPVFLKGERNADGTYKPIPVNEWFVATLDFTGRFTKYPSGAVDATKIGQINFYPYAQYGTATGRKNFNLSFDWIIVGNKQYPAPNLSGVNPTVSICPSALSTTLIGYTSGDSCTLDADKITWNTGATTTSIIPSAAGKYTLVASNYGGTDTAIVNVEVKQVTKSGLTYITPADNTVQVADGTSGPVTSYEWYYFPSTAVVPTTPLSWGLSTSAEGKKAVLLGTGQNPPSFAGSSFSFGTWKDNDFVCLRTQASACYTATADRGACQTVTFAVLSLEELSSSTTNVYPTIVNDQLNIVIGGNLSGNFEVKITDLLGNSHATSTIGTGLNSITVSGIAAGSYLVNISQGSKTLTKKFIKQ